MLDVRAGSRIGPYKVIAPLEEVSARGGMSTLFLAQLAQVDGTQLLLLKLVPVEEMGGERSGMRALNALRKEVELLQRLRHPNIVKIYPIPSRNDGRREHYVSRATNVPGRPWYCTMEYLGGGSLESRLQELTVMPIEEAVEIAYQIGSGLDYMHAKGYVHWDVKPDNILFREARSENGRTQAVLTDFGIARSTHEPAVVAGSVPYMSPERLRVHTGEMPTDQVMDQRPADVYALGVVLYEMLAGSLPYAAEAGEDLKIAILEEPLIPLTDFNYEVPSVLEGVIFQALEKDPANRPTVEEMVTMLDRAVPAPRVGIQAPSGLAGETEADVRTGLAAPPRVRRRREEEEAAEKPRRKPSLLGRLQQGALIVVAAGLIFVGWWVLFGPAAPAPTQTPMPTPNVEATAQAEELQAMQATSTAQALAAQMEATQEAEAEATAAFEATQEAEAVARAAAATQTAKAEAEAAAATQTAQAPTPTYTPPPVTAAPRAVAPNPVSPTGGMWVEGSVNFQWEGTLRSGQTYRVVVTHSSSGHSTGTTTNANSWATALPADKSGQWVWSVSVLQGGSVVETSAQANFNFAPTGPSEPSEPSEPSGPPTIPPP